MTDYIFYIYNTEDYKIYNNSFEIKKLKWNYANELVKNNYYSFLFYRYNAESYLSIDIKQAILQKILKHIQNKNNILNDIDLIYHINLELDILYMTLNYNEKVLIIFHTLLSQC